jgi:putative PIN family toxin of toxin-antitoxin system
VKIVLDTNVLVSGLLNPYGAPGQIVQMIVAERLSLCYDARILCEYREVLLRPSFPFLRQQVETLLEQIRAAGEPIAAMPLPGTLPDPDDAPFLEVAIAGQVEHLVTGNPRHFPVGSRRGIRVVLPADFVELLRS